MLEIRKVTASDAKNILEYCKVIGGESDNLTFGAEGVEPLTEKENIWKVYCTLIDSFIL